MSGDFVKTNVEWRGHEGPLGLCTVEQIAPELGISNERLRELAESGFAPHWRIDNGEPLFKRSEIKGWIKDSGLLKQYAGKFPVPRIVITADTSPSYCELPKRLQILQASVQLFAWPSRFNIGIYFLCIESEVVYVGQSIGLNSRIGQHSERIEFDRAYVLPSLPEHLCDLEGAFIRAWRPRYNGNNGPIPNMDTLKKSHSYLTPVLESPVGEEA